MKANFVQAASLLLLVSLNYQTCNGQQVILYEHADYQGRSHSVTVTRCTNVHEFNNMASSVKTSGCVVLYQDDCCQGSFFQVTGDNKALYSFNDATTSISPCGNYRSPFPNLWSVGWLAGSPQTGLVTEVGPIAIYYSQSVPRGDNVRSHTNFVSWAWDYVKANYGSNYGPEGGRLQVYFWNNWGSGGTISYYFDSKDQCRNSVYLGSTNGNSWTGELESNTNELDMLTHEISHIVEGASKGVHGSPSFGFWRDSMWAEIFIYDVYGALDRRNGGRTSHQQRWYTQMQGSRANFPKPDTYCFRDWFYPIYSRYGGVRMLNNYFELLRANWPCNPNGWQYSGRTLNLGEFVHFFSGAAGVNLKSQANVAFKWDQATENQFQQARSEFPRVTYSG